MAIIRPNPLTDELKATIAGELQALATQHHAALEYKFTKGTEISAGGSHNPLIAQFLTEFLTPEAPAQQVVQAPLPTKPAPSHAR